VWSLSCSGGRSSSHIRALSVSFRYDLLGGVCGVPGYMRVCGRCAGLSPAGDRHVRVSSVVPPFNSLHFRAMCCRLAASCCGFNAATNSPISFGSTSSVAPRKMSATVSMSVNNLRRSRETPPPSPSLYCVWVSRPLPPAPGGSVPRYRVPVVIGWALLDVRACALTAALCGCFEGVTSTSAPAGNNGHSRLPPRVLFDVGCSAPVTRRLMASRFFRRSVRRVLLPSCSSSLSYSSLSLSRSSSVVLSLSYSGLFRAVCRVFIFILDLCC